MIAKTKAGAAASASGLIRLQHLNYYASSRSAPKYLRFTMYLNGYATFEATQAAFDAHPWWEKL